ncbi:STAS domain-containing protein [Moorena sp. SIO3H5]|uniref:STAS domain-containing protein n=1 Tax=Moorena sp. SIO3H5 TaxID=2607834 RepID=UPI0013B615AB|nr:STAS domain-containing protein [Moorena sp. SIO3H5]NEO70265.1 STAS domain-containing protein [Moorena sp. SIO3H5]
MSSAVKVVQPTGILDGTQAADFREEVKTLVESGETIILINFQDVTFMDSSGLGALVLALKTVRAAGGKMFICSVNEQIKMLFDLTSMDKVFDIFPTREDFESEVLSTT